MKKIKTVRTNITIPEDILSWLKKVAFAKNSNVSKEIREIIKYVKVISYWGEREINEKFRK